MNQNQKHTPGPWTVQAVDPDEWAGGMCGVKATVGGYPQMVARVAWGCNAEGQANARLISAAPDLLVSLERVLALAIGHASDAGHNEEHLESCSWVVKARAALAKAKGE